MVRKERLELSRVAPLVPKTSASTNSATFARTSLKNVVGRGTLRELDAAKLGVNWDHSPSGEAPRFRAAV